MKGVQEDFAAFKQDAPDPKAAAEREKLKKEHEKKLFDMALKEAKAQAKKAPAKKAVPPKPSADAEKDPKKQAATKAKLIEKLTSYVEHLEKFFPEAPVLASIPADLSKLGEPDLELLIKLIENFLGKRASYDLVKQGYLQVMNFAERNDHFIGMDLENLSKVAVHSITPQKLPSGVVVPGSAEEVLHEFSAKYAHIFVTGVELRLCMMIVQTIALVNQLNKAQKSGPQEGQQGMDASGRPSVVPKDKMEAL